MKSQVRMAALLCLLFSSASFAQLFQIYEIESMSAVDLGTLGGDEASALDVNDAGEIVGWARLANGTEHAFLYRNGGMQDLTPSFGSMRSSGRGINNNTEVVGHYVQPVGNTFVYKPFYWSEYEATPKTLPMLGAYTEATAINDQGRIVGSAQGAWPDDCGTKPYAVQWLHAYASLERLYCVAFNTTVTRATDVNGAGNVAGYHNQQGQFAWTFPGGLLLVPPFPEPTCKMWAHGINEGGDTVGGAEYCSAPGEQRAYLWDGVAGYSKPLGVLTGGNVSSASEINDQRFVAGFSVARLLTGGLSFTHRDRAFIWHSHFGMKALPVPPGVSGTQANCRANSVSNRDSTGLMRVVGNCVVNGKTRAIRWDVVAKKKLFQPDF